MKFVKNLDEKITIKIINDTAEDVLVMNAGSGGSYSLTKGVTTPIKMEVGNKLYHYNGEKKADLILDSSFESGFFLVVKLIFSFYKWHYYSV